MLPGTEKTTDKKVEQMLKVLRVAEKSGYSKRMTNKQALKSLKPIRKEGLYLMAGTLHDRYKQNKGKAGIAVRGVFNQDKNKTQVVGIKNTANLTKIDIYLFLVLQELEVKSSIAKQAASILGA